MDTNTPKNIPYEFGVSTPVLRITTYQEYAKNRRFSCVFPLSPKVKTLDGFFSKKKTKFFTLTKFVEVLEKSASNDARMSKTCF